MEMARVNEKKKTVIGRKKRDKAIGILILMMSVMMLIMTFSMMALADDATLAAGLDKLNDVVNWIAKWVGRIGLLVAFFGSIQLAFGFMNDDADSKVRGIRVITSGFMVWGVTKTLGSITALDGIGTQPKK